jgi:hypothetical protein
LTKRELEGVESQKIRNIGKKELAARLTELDARWKAKMCTKWTLEDSDKKKLCRAGPFFLFCLGGKRIFV